MTNRPFEITSNCLKSGVNLDDLNHKTKHQMQRTLTFTVAVLSAITEGMSLDDGACQSDIDIIDAAYYA